MRQHGKNRGRVHHLLEPAVLAIESDGGFHVIHDIADLHGSHGIFLTRYALSNTQVLAKNCQYWLIFAQRQTSGCRRSAGTLGAPSY